MREQRPHTYGSIMHEGAAASHAQTRQNGAETRRVFANSHSPTAGRRPTSCTGRPGPTTRGSVVVGVCMHRGSVMRSERRLVCQAAQQAAHVARALQLCNARARAARDHGAFGARLSLPTLLPPSAPRRRTHSELSLLLFPTSRANPPPLRTSSVSGSILLSTAMLSSWALVLSTRPFCPFFDMVESCSGRCSCYHLLASG